MTERPKTQILEKLSPRFNDPLNGNGMTSSVKILKNVSWMRLEFLCLLCRVCGSSVLMTFSPLNGGFFNSLENGIMNEFSDG